MAKKIPTRHREAVADLRRQQILEASLRVFGKKGFSAARIQDVATESGIAKGTVYLYFSSKEEIYAAAVIHALEQLSALIEERLNGVKGFRKRLAYFIALRLEFWRGHKSLYRMILTVGREPQHRKQTHLLTQRVANSVRSLMDEAVKTGELKKQNLAPVALAVVDMMRGFNERQIEGSSKLTPQQEAAEITRITLAALGFKS